MRSHYPRATSNFCFDVRPVFFSLRSSPNFFKFPFALSVPRLMHTTYCSASIPPHRHPSSPICHPHLPYFPLQNCRKSEIIILRKVSCVRCHMQDTSCKVSCADDLRKAFNTGYLAQDDSNQVSCVKCSKQRLHTKYPKQGILRKMPHTVLFFKGNNYLMQCYL